MIHQNASLKLGLYSLDTKFNFIQSASLFVNDAFDAGLELSETRISGPPIFPNSALGIRLRFDLKDGAYIQSALVDGVPGNPNNPYGTQVCLGKDDGFEIATEIGYEWNQDNSAQRSSIYQSRIEF